MADFWGRIEVSRTFKPITEFISLGKKPLTSSFEIKFYNYKVVHFSNRYATEVMGITLQDNSFLSVVDIDARRVRLDLYPSIELYTNTLAKLVLRLYENELNEYSYEKKELESRLQDWCLQTFYYVYHETLGLEPHIHLESYHFGVSVDYDIVLGTADRKYDLKLREVSLNKIWGGEIDVEHLDYDAPTKAVMHIVESTGFELQMHLAVRLAKLWTYIAVETLKKFKKRFITDLEVVRK